MLKQAYKVKWNAAEIKILILKKLARMQRDEINKLKAENQRYKEGYERAYLGPAIESKARQINTIA